MATFYGFMRLFFPSITWGLETKFIDFLAFEKVGVEYEAICTLKFHGETETSEAFNAKSECVLGCLVALEEFLVYYADDSCNFNRPLDVFENDHDLPLLRGMLIARDSRRSDPPAPLIPPDQAPF